MKTDFLNNSVVILAQSHNPTLLSDYFLLKAGIIDDINKINREHFLVTPAFSRVILSNGTLLEIEPERFKIEGNFGIDIPTKGMFYFKSLPYIRCKAVGINFHTLVSDFDFKKFFSKFSFDDNISVNSIKYKYQVNNLIVNIESLFLTDDSCRFNFNFHYSFNDKTFEEITLDFIKEWEQNKDMVIPLINKLLIK